MGRCPLGQREVGLTRLSRRLSARSGRNGPLPTDPLEAVTRAVRETDDALTRALNAAVRRSALMSRIVGRLAAWLAGVEVALMLFLALVGRRRAATHMLGTVALVYLVCDALGAIWPRQRPFARLSDVEALTPHTPERSFPSRHVASGLAMAALGGRAHPRLGATMAGVAWLLGACRVAAGLHYPTDILGGALLGRAVGGLAQSASRTRSAESIRTRPSAASSWTRSRLPPAWRTRSASATASPSGTSLKSWTMRPR